MPFDSALNATQLGYLRGTSLIPRDYRIAVYLSAVPNTNVYTAQVNQASFDYPLAEVTYDTGVGTLADVQTGMTILISHTNDRTAAHFRGRIRKTPTATVFYINETGADIQDDDYIFVINDYQVREILPREVAGKPVPDWDVAFRELKPIIYGLRSAYAGFISSSTGSKLEISFAPSVVWAASGSAANGATPYSWDVPTGGTITVGSSTTQNITVRFDAGFADWVSFTAMDDNDTSHTFRFFVWAYDKASNAPTLLAWNDLTIQAEIPLAVNEGAGDGHTGTVTAYADVSTLLDETLVCAWCVQSYNGTAVNLGSAGNILLVGRLRQEENQTTYDDQAQQDGQVTLTIEGPLAQLARLRVPPLYLELAASPDDWNQIKSLTLWRAAWLVLSEYSTFASLHSPNFIDNSDTFLYSNLNTQGGDLAYSVADLFQSITAVLQDNGAGMCEVARRGNMLGSAARDALTTVANFDNRDYRAISLMRDYDPAIGLLKGAGGGYHTTSGTLTAYDVQAPRGAPGQWVGEAQLYRQILAANQNVTDERAELEQRAGDAYAAQQTPDRLPMELPPGYRWLVPDVAQWMTWTLAASETTRGRAYDTNTRWWLSRIRQHYQFDDDGQIVTEVSAQFVIETDGGDGAVVDYDPPNVGEFPATPVEIGALPTPLPAVESSTILDTSGATSNCGSYAGGDWSHDCCGGYSLIDIEIPLGDIKTLTSISVTYTADTTIASPINAIQVKILGRPYQTVDAWTTVSGSNQTHTATLGGISATHIRVILYGSSDCAGTITLTQVSYTALGSAVIETVEIPTENDAGNDTTAPLQNGVMYRIKISGTYIYDTGSGRMGDGLYRSITGAVDSYSTYSVPTNVRVDTVAVADGYWLDYVDATFNPDHIYEFDWLGAGAVINLSFRDSLYADNSGSLFAEIRRL